MNSNKTHIVLLTDCLAELDGGVEKQIFGTNPAHVLYRDSQISSLKVALDNGSTSDHVVWFDNRM